MEGQTTSANMRKPPGFQDRIHFKHYTHFSCEDISVKERNVVWCMLPLHNDATENNRNRGQTYRLEFDGPVEVEALEVPLCWATLSMAPEVEAPENDEDASPAKWLEMAACASWLTAALLVPFGQDAISKLAKFRIASRTWFNNLHWFASFGFQ